jgi:hypothetical protein
MPSPIFLLKLYNLGFLKQGKIFYPKLEIKCSGLCWTFANLLLCFPYSPSIGLKSFSLLEKNYLF